MQMHISNEYIYTYLGIMYKAFEIHGPNGEKPNENMKSYKGTENNSGVDNVNARNNCSKPQSIEDTERPDIEAPPQALLPQQINFIYHLPSHMEPRHLYQPHYRFKNQTHFSKIKNENKIIEQIM